MLRLNGAERKLLSIMEPAKSKVAIRKGDARKLDGILNESIARICTHPLYADIIKYSDGIDGDLYQLKVKDFLEQMKPVAEGSYRVLKKQVLCRTYGRYPSERLYDSYEL